eukprot:m.66209 g.66209  ORF g.66209 m.66209 type:complete len:50 (-) comp11789_c0_seq2:1003-1152(-)
MKIQAVSMKKIVESKSSQKKRDCVLSIKLFIVHFNANITLPLLHMPVWP